MSKLCEEVREQLPLYIDRLLTEEEQSTLEEHLQKCADCQEELAFLNGILGTAKTLPELLVTENFRSGLKEKLATVEVRTRGLGQRKTLYRYLSGAVAAAAVIVFSVVSFHNLPEHPDLTSNAPSSFYTKQATQTPSAAPVVPTGSPELQVGVQRAGKEGNCLVTSPAPQIPAQESAEEQQGTQSEMIDQSKERSIKAPIAEEVQAVSATDDMPAAYEGTKETEWKIRFYVSEESHEAALSVIEPYEKYEEGALVPKEQLSAVTERISSLPGFISMENQNKTLKESPCVYIEIHIQP